MRDSQQKQCEEPFRVLFTWASCLGRAFMAASTVTQPILESPFCLVSWLSLQTAAVSGHMKPYSAQGPYAATLGTVAIHSHTRTVYAASIPAIQGNQQEPTF